jgi:4-hydroxy-tetrahydrodipicolinate synthase
LTKETKDLTNLTVGGVLPILPTPFTAEGAIDDDGFAKVIEAAIASGVQGVSMFGLASEYYKLSDAERANLTTMLVRQVGKRCPVVISIVSHATKLAVAEAIQAVEAGADALMIFPPFFLGPSSHAIIKHIREIAAAVPVPVIVQYAPLQTGRPIEVRTFAELHTELPNISHVKVDLVPSGPLISALCSYGVGTLAGYMGLHLPEDVSRGLGGVMPTVSVSARFVRIWQLMAQDEQQARSLHCEMLPLLNLMMQSIECLIACEKELLVRCGIIRSAHCREPAYHLDSIQKCELDGHAARNSVYSELVRNC